MSVPTSSSLRWQRNGRQKSTPWAQRCRRSTRTIRTSRYSFRRSRRKPVQEAILAKEKEASELKKKYFGPEGELFKKRTSLMTPIQEEIYNAVKDISELRGYSLVLDRASDTGIIFASPKVDISNEVLTKLGYSAN